MANAKPNDRMEEHMPQPSIQVATQRLRQSVTWCNQWRDAHPKWFRAGLVACALSVLYVCGWLLSLVRAVLWLLIMLAIGTAGLLWASQRWTGLVAVLESRRWLLTRRPYVALVAAAVMSVAIWCLPSSRSTITEHVSDSANSVESMEESAAQSRSETTSTSTEPSVANTLGRTPQDVEPDDGDRPEPVQNPAQPSRLPAAGIRVPSLRVGEGLSPESSFHRLVSLRVDARSAPTNQTFTVISRLDDNHFEVVIAQRHAVLRTYFTQINSAGELLLPLVRSGNITVHTKTGFDEEWELLCEALSDSGAFALSAAEVAKRRSSLQKQIDASRRETIAGLLAKGYSANDVDGLAGFLKVAVEGSNRSDLLDLHARVSAANTAGLRPIHFATQEGDVELLRLLIRAGEKPSELTTKGQPAIHIAIEKHASDLKLTESLLLELKRGGANLTGLNRDGQTTLHLSVERDNDALVRLLVRLGVPIDVSNNSGLSPLQLAAQRGASCLGTLIELGASISRKTKDGQTLLHLACRQGKRNAAKELLDHKANPDTPANDGSTPLHDAAKDGHRDVVSLLLASGASRIAKDVDGHTPAGVAKDQQILSSLLIVGRIGEKAEQAWTQSCPDGTVITGWSEGGSECFVRCLHPDASEKWRFSIDGRSVVFGWRDSDGTIHVLVDGLDGTTILGLDKTGQRTRVLPVPATRQASNPFALVADSRDNVIHVVDLLGRLQPKCINRPVSTTGMMADQVKVEIETIVKAKIDTLVSAPVVGSDGAIYLVDRRNGLVAIDRSGKLRWQITLSERRIDIAAVATGADGVVYILFGDRLVAVDQTGTKKWESLVGRRQSGFPIPPVVGTDGRLYVCANLVYAISPQGQKLWSQSFAADFAPVIASDGAVFVADIFSVSRITPKGELTGKMNFTLGGTSSSGLCMTQEEMLHLHRGNGQVHVLNCKFWQ